MPWTRTAFGRRVWVAPPPGSGAAPHVIRTAFGGHVLVRQHGRISGHLTRSHGRVIGPRMGALLAYAAGASLGYGVGRAIGPWFQSLTVAGRGVVIAGAGAAAAAADVAAPTRPNVQRFIRGMGIGLVGGAAHGLFNFLRGVPQSLGQALIQRPGLWGTFHPF